MILRLQNQVIAGFEQVWPKATQLHAGRGLIERCLEMNSRVVSRTLFLESVPREVDQNPLSQFLVHNLS